MEMDQNQNMNPVNQNNPADSQMGTEQQGMPNPQTEETKKPEEGTTESEAPASESQPMNQ